MTRNAHKISVSIRAIGRWAYVTIGAAVALTDSWDRLYILKATLPTLETTRWSCLARIIPLSFSRIQLADKGQSYFDPLE